MYNRQAQLRAAVDRLGVYIVSMNETDTSVFLNRYALCIFESITSVVKTIATIARLKNNAESFLICSTI